MCLLNCTELCFVTLFAGEMYPDCVVQTVEKESKLWAEKDDGIHEVGLSCFVH